MILLTIKILILTKGKFGLGYYGGVPDHLYSLILLISMHKIKIFFVSFWGRGIACQ